MSRTQSPDFHEKRRFILDNAACVFATQGMERASMSQIATHCRISKALLYHYYPGKSALIFDIIHTHLQELDQAVAASNDRSLPPDRRLRQLIGTVLEKYRGANNQHNVQINGIKTLGDQERSIIRDVERKIVSHFSSTIRELRPEIDNKDKSFLMPVTMSLFGILNWVYMWFREDGPLTREEYADLATTLILEGIKAVR